MEGQGCAVAPNTSHYAVKRQTMITEGSVDDVHLHALEVGMLHNVLGHKSFVRIQGQELYATGE